MKKRFFHWVLEQKQHRKKPLVPTRNLFGKSAREVGTYPSTEDLEIERPQNVEKGQHDSICFHMADDEGSWLILRADFHIDFARLDLWWNHQVNGFLIKV